jgi:sugar phosphate isomerase/epimerase
LNQIIVFTKLLKNKSLSELASLGQQLVLDGFDLCVRPGYPVNPDNVLETLAPTVKALSEAGLSVPMVSGGLDLVDPNQSSVERILKAMDQAGVRLLKLGYFPFDPLTQEYWPAVSKARWALARWEELGKTYQVKLCYHTHSRGFLGQNCAALMHLIDGFNPSYIGAFIDPVHLVLEGEEFIVGAAMVQQYLGIVSIKDVMLRRVEAGGHSTVEFDVVPCGTGMVDFDSVFSTLRRVDFKGPLTVHCEFENANESEFSNLIHHEVDFARAHKRSYLSGQQVVPAKALA